MLINPLAVFVRVFLTCRFVTQLEGAGFIFHRPVVAVQSNSRIYRAIFVYMDSLPELQMCGTVCCKASTTCQALSIQHQIYSDLTSSTSYNRNMTRKAPLKILELRVKSYIYRAWLN